MALAERMLRLPQKRVELPFVLGRRFVLRIFVRGFVRVRGLGRSLRAVLLSDGVDAANL
jgi:hypothetical protein